MELLRLIILIVLGVFVTVLSASTYGLGKEEHDKTSLAYQSATTFAIMSCTMVSIVIAVLIFMFMQSN